MRSGYELVGPAKRKARWDLALQSGAEVSRPEPVLRGFAAIPVHDPAAEDSAEEDQRNRCRLRCPDEERAEALASKNRRDPKELPCPSHEASLRVPLDVDVERRRSGRQGAGQPLDYDRGLDHSPHVLGETERMREVLRNV